VQSLKFSLRIRDASVDDDKLLHEGVHLVPTSSNSDVLTFSIEDRFTRELAIARLKTKSAFTDSSFNRERLIVSTGDFETFVDAIFASDAVKIKSEVATIRRTEKIRDCGRRRFVNSERGLRFLRCGAPKAIHRGVIKALWASSSQLTIFVIRPAQPPIC
jgi:hypothetical protein